MIRAFRSEWLKLRRPGMLLGAGGTVTGFAVLATVLIFTRATDTANGGRLARRVGVTLASLSQQDGIVRGFRASAQLIGIVALATFAVSIASEYSLGTLRSLLTRQPRRAHLLAGKLLAVATFVLAAVVVAFVVSCTIAFPLAHGRGISTDAWTTNDGVRGALSELVNVALATLGWGAAGAALAIVLRSSAAAIGTGLAWLIAGEAIVIANWDSGNEWLPGRVTEAFAAGGNTNATYEHAATVLALYCAVYLSICFITFARRDVTT